MTEYVVLSSDGEVWVRHSQEAARSSQAAIRAFLDVEGNQSSYNSTQFVAVPARSWKPVTVKVETKTALKFS